MSFLAPLYALGLLAVAAPVLFHLIRRRPKGKVPFGSLMFLSPSPPPPTNRRKLEQILLMLLRAGALVLLGLAFMRPFLRDEATADPGEPGQRVAVLIDTSASLRRGDLWAKAVAQTNAVLTATKQTDRVGVYAFDRTVRPVLTFAEAERLDPSLRLAVARDRLAKLSPTWAGTDLGRALIDGVSAVLEPGAAAGGKAGRVVLVSDLQQGAKLADLTGFEWPADVGLELRTVSDDRGNAGVDFLADRADADRTAAAGQLRVRVVNDAGAKGERFKLAWDGSTDVVEAYVPPGEGRVVKVPRPASGRLPVLRLTGDAHPFDNAAYLAVPKREDSTVFYVGPDAANDPAGLLYFLDRAWPETPERAVTVKAHKPGEPLAWDRVKASPLVVLAGETPGDVPARYLNDGGTLAVVFTDPKAILLAGLPSAVEEAPSARYAMLKDIAFDHPLFAPLAGPQFGDFTKVHFWKHRRVPEAGARVLARFDDGDPAVLERTVGRGRLIVFATGWQPADSQLARSSKFVPLMEALLELRGGTRAVGASYRVGDKVPLPTPGPVTVRTPDEVVVSPPVSSTTFDATDRPGVYSLETPTGPRPFAVNLDPAESLTTPLPPETLERYGCRLAPNPGDQPRGPTEQQLRDVELERTQSIWRGLVLAALAVLIAETALAGWRGRSVSSGAES